MCHGRCSPENAANFVRSSLDLSEEEDEDCPEDCTNTKYSLSVSRADLTDAVKLHLRDKVPSGQNIKAVVMKLRGPETQGFHCRCFAKLLTFVIHPH